MDAINVVEARKNFSDLMLRVAYGKQRIVVERHGKPMMVLISLEDYALLQAHRRDTEASRGEAQAALDEASSFRRRLLAERGGVPMPDSADLIAEIREERLDELTYRD